MAYTKTNWVNNTTPINATNLNKIENELEALDKDINYSTTEQVIGTWITGKPLYRKVVHLGTLVSNNTIIVSSGLDSSTRVNKIYGYAIHTSSYEALPLPFIWGSTSEIQVYISLFFGGTNNNSDIWCRTNRTNAENYDAYAILEYTKTTD